MSNLAYQEDYLALPQRRALPEFTPERHLQAEREKRRLQEQQLEAARLAARQIYREVSQQRRLLLFQAVGLILILAAVFSFLLTRQSKLMEANFANTRLNREIQEQLKTNDEAHLEMMRQLDLQRIAEQANQLFGLKAPTQAQRVALSVPKVDHSTLYDEENREAKSVVQNYSLLEDYVKKQDGSHAP